LDKIEVFQSAAYDDLNIVSYFCHRAALKILAIIVKPIFFTNHSQS
jgi:hypothetical protein